MKVNLVLSGGASRGIAHIGVIKALEELGFEIRAISGVSAGALVGAFYCDGYTPEEMLRVVKSKEWLKYLRPAIPRLGFVSLKEAEKYLNKMLSIRRIEEAKKKLFIGALDIKSGKTFYFDSEDLVPILLGSCALPGIFEPVRYKDYLLIDGGITNNLPVEPLGHKHGGARIGKGHKGVYKPEHAGRVAHGGHGSGRNARDQYDGKGAFYGVEQV